MKRPLLALVGAAMLASVLPAAASADPITKYDEHRISLGCDSQFDGGAAQVFADVSSVFGSSLFAAVWQDPASPAEDPPTAAGQTETVDLVEGTDSFTLSGTVPLTDPDDVSVGDGIVEVAMVASGPPTPVTPAFPSNHHSGTTGTDRPYAGQATLHFPGLDVTIQGCTAVVTDVHVFEANPTAFIVDPQGVRVDCTWTTPDSFAALSAGQDAFGFFAFAVETTPEHQLFDNGQSTGSMTPQSLAADLTIVDPATGEVSNASANATFGLLGTPVVSTLVSATRREKITEQALAANGTFAFSAGGSYIMDPAHCRAAQYASHVIGTQPTGPKAGGKPPANDLPDGAIPIAPGARLNAQTRGAALEPEVPITTCPEGIGDNMGHTLWYAIAGTGRGVTVDTAGSDIDTLIGVYTRSGDEFTEIGCIDDVFRDPAGSTFQAALTFGTTQGEVYYVQIGGFRRFFSDSAEYGRLRVAVR